MPTKKLFFIIELVVKRAICVDISTHIVDRMLDIKQLWWVRQQLLVSLRIRLQHF